MVEPEEEDLLLPKEIQFGKKLLQLRSSGVVVADEEEDDDDDAALVVLLFVVWPVVDFPVDVSFGVGGCGDAVASDATLFASAFMDDIKDEGEPDDEPDEGEGDGEPTEDVGELSGGGMIVGPTMPPVLLLAGVVKFIIGNGGNGGDDVGIGGREEDEAFDGDGEGELATTAKTALLPGTFGIIPPKLLNPPPPIILKLLFPPFPPMAIPMFMFMFIPIDGTGPRFIFMFIGIFIPFPPIPMPTGVPSMSGFMIGFIIGFMIGLTPKLLIELTAAMF